MTMPASAAASTYSTGETFRNTLPANTSRKIRNVFQSTTDFFHSFTTALRMSTHTHTRMPANAFCTAGRCAKF